MVRIASDVTRLVGRTPLVALSRVAPSGVELVGKLEAWNPSGSNKDRAALGMIQHAERAGFLKRGGVVVECSSGDLGLSVAMVGRRLGYRVVLTMPESTPRYRRRLLHSLGAEVVVTPDVEGMRGAMSMAERIADVADVEPLLLAEIAHFFTVYKDVEPGKSVEVGDWEGRAVAERAIDAARLRHDA